VAGFFSIGIGIHRWHGGYSDHQAFERHVADICVQAAAKSCTCGTAK
jgi:hypothetical protein